MIRYQGRHRSQYATGATSRLRSMGCTPTSLANALRCATGGAVDLSGDQVLAKVANAEETNPATSGWSLEDAKLAASRIPGAPAFTPQRGPWSGVTAALAGGYGVVLQGDSDQFTSGCSGEFDGDHCIFVHPDRSPMSGLQRKGDPICADWNAETLTVLRNYAEKLSGLQVRFGTFAVPVPLVVAPAPAPAPAAPPPLSVLERVPFVAKITSTVPDASVVRIRDGRGFPVPQGDDFDAVEKGRVPAGPWGFEGEVYIVHAAAGECVALVREFTPVAQIPAPPEPATVQIPAPPAEPEPEPTPAPVIEEPAPEPAPAPVPVEVPSEAPVEALPAEPPIPPVLTTWPAPTSDPVEPWKPLPRVFVPPVSEQADPRGHGTPYVPRESPLVALLRALLALFRR